MVRPSQGDCIRFPVIIIVIIFGPNSCVGDDDDVDEAIVYFDQDPPLQAIEHDTELAKRSESLNRETQERCTLHIIQARGLQKKRDFQGDAPSCTNTGSIFCNCSLLKVVKIVRCNNGTVHRILRIHIAHAYCMYCTAYCTFMHVL